MAIGELLRAKGIISAEQLSKVLHQQKIAGGRLGDNLVALGFIGRGDLEAILQEPPPVAKTIAATGLETNFLLNSLLRLMYISALQTIPEISEQIKLTRPIVEDLLNFAKKESLVEIRGPSEKNINILRYALTNAGKERASEALRVCEYLGPAPIPLEEYQTQVQKQTITNEVISIDKLQKAMSHLVLSDEVVRRLGPASNSGRAILIYGAAGNGKTSIAEALVSAFEQPVYVPYAIEVDGQVIKVFDLHNHHPVAVKDIDRYDQRWIRIKRPIVIVGGEMTIETMDLIYSSTVRFYEAPFQMKSNGGTLVIDDFGRQRVDPHDLLNRWIVPLEGRVDYLTLHTGKKIEVPFEQLLIFATNLDPSDLVDDAFLRRMGYRLYVNAPDREMYAAIFQQFVQASGFDYDPQHLEYVFRLYDTDKRPLRGCEPRDLIQRCSDLCKYENRPMVLSNELLHLAWQNYFGAAPTVN